MNVPSFAIFYVIGMLATAICLPFDSDWRDSARETATADIDPVLLMWICTLATSILWPVFWAAYWWPKSKAPPS